MIKHVKPSGLFICRRFAAAALGCLALNALSAPIPKGGRQPFSVETSQGNLQTYSVMGTAHSGTYFRDPIVSTSSPSVSAKVPMPFANKGGTSSDATLTWPVDTQKTIAAASSALEAGLAGLSSGNGYVAAATVACAFFCEPAISALTSWGLEKFKDNGDGTFSAVVPDPSVEPWTSDGYLWQRGGKTSFDPASLCDPSLDQGPLGIAPFAGLVFDGSTSAHCTYRGQLAVVYNGGVSRTSTPSSCSAGSPVINGVCGASAPTKDVPLQTYLSSNYTGKGWDHYWAGITAGLVAAGVNVFTDGTGSTITGPAVVPVSTSETRTPINLSPGTTTPAPTGSTGPTDSGTQTTTTTTTAHNTYRPGSAGSGPSMETKTQTQTTTNITNNITNNTSSTVITNTTETDKAPEKEDKDFCEKNPDSLACAETDTPEQETPTGNLNISYEYVDIFGNGSCPSDSYLSTHGQNLKVWDWAATCDNVQSYFRPILIACCAFAAFVIVSAGAKE